MPKRSPLALLALLVAGCTGGTSTSTPTDTGATTTPPASSPTAVAGVDDAPATETTTPAPSTAPAVGGDPDDAATLSSIAVSSAAVPAEVANALRDNGGELADTSDWTDRFGADGIPTVDGPGVSLVEATLATTETDSGWSRTDAMQWLFTSSTERDTLLDQIAFEAGVAGTQPQIESSTVDAADCVVRTYPRSDNGDEWLIQGCSFDQFSNMVSIGITRTSALDDPITGLDPSIATVIANLDADLGEIAITFGAPEPGSTSTLSMSVAVVTDVDDAAEQLAAGSLSTWNRQSGEAGLVTFAGAPGSYWNVTPSAVRFSHEGRLDP